MAYGMTSTTGYSSRGSQADQQRAEQRAAGSEGYSAGSRSGAATGALMGAQYGATTGAAIGSLVTPVIGTAIGGAIGLVGGAIVGAFGGSMVGGNRGEKEAVAAEKQAQADKRRSDILARQTRTAMQQEAKAASGPRASTVKAPPMGAVSGADAAMQAMPSTSGKGTAYDTWRSTVYGG